MEAEGSPVQGGGVDAVSDAIRGEVRLVGHRRVSHGLFLPLRPGLPTEQELLRELQAWQLVLPEGAAFTHVTGAKMRGWQLPKLPEQIPVFAAVEGNPSRPQRPGLICSRLVRATNADMVHGVPVDSPEEILLRAARDFGLLDMTILVDSAKRLGQVDDRRMSAILGSSRPGVRMLALAWSMSDNRADSGGETVLRLFHRVIDVPVEPQAVLTDESGNVVGRADLLIVGTQAVQEYDGDGHRDKEQHKIDLRRDRGLSATSYRRHGYTLDDLLNYPNTVMHEIDRMLGRPHRMARVRRWQRLVEDSLYSERGRERVLNRWRRLNGFFAWSRTA
jgi:hypothetical protein